MLTTIDQIRLHDGAPAWMPVQRFCEADTPSWLVQQKPTRKIPPALKPADVSSISFYFVSMFEMRIMHSVRKLYRTLDIWCVYMGYFPWPTLLPAFHICNWSSIRQQTIAYLILGGYAGNRSQRGIDIMTPEGSPQSAPLRSPLLPTPLPSLIPIAITRLND